MRFQHKGVEGSKVSSSVGIDRISRPDYRLMTRFGQHRQRAEGYTLAYSQPLCPPYTSSPHQRQAYRVTTVDYRLFSNLFFSL